MPRRKKEEPAALKQIETLCEAHAANIVALDVLALTVRKTIQVALADSAPALRKATDALAESEKELHRAIDANRSAFSKPKTRKLHGIKVGLRANPGSVIYSCDDDTMVARLRDMFGPNEIGTYVEESTSVKKTPLRDLDEKTRKRLGVEVVGVVDTIVITVETSEPAKIAETLLDFAGIKP